MGAAGIVAVFNGVTTLLKGKGFISTVFSKIM
jgi:hypothetical protein